MSNSVIQNVSPVNPVPRTVAQASNTPEELWDIRQWVVWGYEPSEDPDKPKKVPYNPKIYGKSDPKTGRRYTARTCYEWPDDWTDIRTAAKVYKQFETLSGIGFEVTERDPYVFGDLDNCIVKGTYSPLACELLDTLGTYAEISPSGRGIRLIVRCDHKPRNLKAPGIEFYSHERFMTMTGNVINCHPIAHFEDLDWLLDPFRTQTATQEGQQLEAQLLFASSPKATPEADKAILERMSYRNPKAYRLFHGDLSQHSNDYSYGVTRLLQSLAIFTGGNVAQMDRMIRQSALNSPKFDEKRRDITWLQARILEALKYRKNYLAKNGKGK